MVVDIILFVVMLVVMFLPTFIANAREHKNTGVCFWINLLLGWSAIVWLPLLVWSLVSSTK